jgi:5-methylcytosine-specific restriction endonuclease McrA
VLLDGLADGSLTLTTVCLLARHLTDGNHVELLTRAAHKSKREVEHLVSALDPQPPVAASVRKLPPPRHAAFAPPLLDSANASPQRDSQPGLPAEDVSEPHSNVVTSASHVSTPAPQSHPTALEDARRGPRARPAVIQSLAPEQYKVQVTVGAETVGKLRRVQDLMRHAIPDGDPAAILDRALTMLLEHLERTRLASVRRPVAARPLASRSRQVPASVRRAVWARDEGRCAFVGTTGRCAETAFLEFHHVVPYAAGGDATIDTIQLRCRAHNQYEAELDFGPRRTRRGSPSSPPLLRERRDVYCAAATRSGPS